MFTERLFKYAQTICIGFDVASFIPLGAWIDQAISDVNKDRVDTHDIIIANGTTKCSSQTAKTNNFLFTTTGLTDIVCTRLR